MFLRSKLGQFPSKEPGRDRRTPAEGKKHPSSFGRSQGRRRIYGGGGGGLQANIYEVPVFKLEGSTARRAGTMLVSNNLVSPTGLFDFCLVFFIETSLQSGESKQHHSLTVARAEENLQHAIFCSVREFFIASLQTLYYDIENNSQY